MENQTQARHNTLQTRFGLYFPLHSFFLIAVGKMRDVTTAMRDDFHFRPMAAAIVFAMFRSAVAHPSFWSVDAHCTADAHPSSNQGEHGAPQKDPSITFLLGWAAPNANDAPQGEETNPDRLISQVRAMKRVDERPPSCFLLSSFRWPIN